LQKHYEHEPVKGRSEESDLARRHHYSPNPESVVHLNRFEQAYREKEGSEIRHKVFAKVLRDFRASRDNEISVRKGDIVIISRQIDQNWVEIEDTQSGLKVTLIVHFN
jgi:CRISPR/Cas system-associated protein Cas5 (RAMP superfamily)